MFNLFLLFCFYKYGSLCCFLIGFFIFFLKEIFINYVKVYVNNGMIFDFYVFKKKLKICFFIGKLKWNF